MVQFVLHMCPKGSDQEKKRGNIMICVVPKCLMLEMKITY